MVQTSVFQDIDKAFEIKKQESPISPSLKGNDLPIVKKKKDFNKQIKKTKSFFTKQRKLPNIGGRLPSGLVSRGNLVGSTSNPFVKKLKNPFI